MKNAIFIIIFLLLNINSYSYSNDTNCDEFNKFSVNYMKCKANLIKDKTVSVGKNFVEDTKNYQKKEWTKEKVKLNNVKKKVLD